MWTVKRNAKVISSDTTILLLLDKIYEKTLQANQLELDEKTINEYGEYKSNTTLANRHIALLFDNYQTIINETSAKGEKAPAEICIPLMKSLSAECLSLYNRIPVIVCIYMGEALQSAGMIDEAREHFKLSLQFYPNSIPLLVNEYRLEKDPIKQKEKLAKLKSKYPEHWMVMEL
jgi:tetratricopeptide (TPR) repeat protein